MRSGPGRTSKTSALVWIVCWLHIHFGVISEMCGLIAVAGSTNSALETFAGLMNLQHRGQDGAGILSVDSKKSGGFHLQKGSGLIENVFSERSFKNLTAQLRSGMHAMRRSVATIQIYCNLFLITKQESVWDTTVTSSISIRCAKKY
jgi:hypothetical protein